MPGQTIEVNKTGHLNPYYHFNPQSCDPFWQVPLAGHERSLTIVVVMISWLIVLRLVYSGISDEDERHAHGNDMSFVM